MRLLAFGKTWERCAQLADLRKAVVVALAKRTVPPQTAKKGQERANVAWAVKADERNRAAGEAAVCLHAEGRPLGAIGAELARLGLLPPRGGEWSPTQVRRLLARYANDER